MFSFDTATFFMFANRNGLTRSQIEGIAAGLTREQVYHAWFTEQHARAALK